MTETPIYEAMLAELAGLPADFFGATPAKGDRLRWRDEVDIEITRVAGDRTWVDLQCSYAGATWTKRQSLPLPADYQPVEAEAEAEAEQPAGEPEASDG